jgi:hypothetical protein
MTSTWGRLFWASPALPGATHDLTAARTHNLIDTLTARTYRPSRIRDIKARAAA